MLNEKNNSKFRGGFTLIEMAVVLLILGILVATVFPYFSKIGGNEALDTTVISVMSVLNEARSQAISSKNATTSGVRIFNNKLISFQGSYGNLNKEYTISNLVSVSTSTGIGTDIIFSNVSGISNTSGTITVRILREPTKTATIKIYNTGAIEKI